MAIKSNKFGTFGGVFVPSILTILGVIMYLRLPKVVGEGGLLMTLGIILAAHVISITTGLSIASIATDKKVGAGGPYYIVSRSLGLPIGGTLGMALFVGLSFSVSLYLIGFSESLLPQLGFEGTAHEIRICGTLSLLGVAGITLASTSLAIKAQYVILSLIGLSLLSVFLGSGAEVPATPHLNPAEGGGDFGTLFGIFFPAVTGFTAGVNMSGDLKDPKRSIPVGTMAAIGVGLVVYIGLSIFVAYRVPASEMRDNTRILEHIAWIGPAVTAGIWGATLSSAMGSVLGAPRILQALAVDRVMPRFFAKGAGSTNEPRRALVLAALIAESGILIGQLDVIARIVSIFFIAMYGFLNLSCAIESWAGTDFRPSFRIPRMVSVIGGATCLLIMIELDKAATAGAVVLFAAAFLILKRRELALESGDAWRGVWFSLVRSNLLRLTRSEPAESDFRPNMIGFSRHASPSRPHLVSFGTSLVRNGGVLTDFEICRPKEVDEVREERARDEAMLPAGVFHRLLPAAEPYGEIRSRIQYYGFAGLEPNTLLLAWSEHRDNLVGLTDLFEAAAERDLSAMVLAPNTAREPGPSPGRQIDLWWSPERGNFTFSLALVRRLIAGDPWKLAKVRFLLINDRPTRTDALKQVVRRRCLEARIEAAVKVLNNTIGDRPYEDWVRKESAEADLVVLGLPSDPVSWDPELFRHLEGLTETLGHLLLVRPSSAFPAVLSVTAAPESERRSSLLPPDALTEALPEMELPEVAELAAEALRVADGLSRATKDLAERGLAPVFKRHHRLVGEVRELIEGRFDLLVKGLDSVGLRQRRVVARAESTFLQGAGKVVDGFSSGELDELGEVLEARVERFAKTLIQLKEEAPAQMLVLRREAAAEDADEPGEGETRPEPRTVKLTIPLERLLSFYLDFRVPRVLSDALFLACRGLIGASLGLARVLNATRTSLNAFSAQIRAGELTVEQVERERDALLETLGELTSAIERAQREAVDSLVAANQRALQDLAADLNRDDLRRWIRQARRVPRAALEQLEELTELPGRWRTNETLLWRRSVLEMTLGSFYERLAVIAERTKDMVRVELGGGVVAELAQLLTSLNYALERTRQKGRIRFDLPPSLGDGLDEQRIIDDVVRKTQAAAGTLPESFETVAEDVLHLIEEDPFTDVGALVVPVRRRVEFLVQAELVGRLQQGLTEADSAEGRALGAARDVLRLISFNLHDLEESGEIDDEEAFRGRMEPIIASGITRVEVELEELKVFVPRLSALIDRQLEAVAERSDVHDLTGTGDAQGGYPSGRSARRQAISSLRAAASQVRHKGREALTGLFYRRSSGVVLARQLQGGLGPEEVLVERVLKLAESCSPRPEVVEALPFYYQHPFLGRTRISADFWVGREDELREAAQAVARARGGAKGALVVAGERGTGKSALCRTIANTHCSKDRVHHLFPPTGGSTDPEVFKRSLEGVLGHQGEYPAVFGALPEGSALVLHDLELWWERSPEGLAVLEVISQLIDEQSGRCLFILNLNVHALRFINRLIPLVDLAISLIECGPVDARVLKEIVMLRHRSTGFTFRLGGRDEAGLGEWRLARLFSQHFDYCDGAVGVGLQSWIAHITEVEGRTLEVVPPERPEPEVLHELPTEWISLLVEMVLHQQVTFERLERITELRPFVLRHLVSTLARMRLLESDKQGVIELNRYVSHLVRAHLLERKVLV